MTKHLCNAVICPELFVFQNLFKSSFLVHWTTVEWCGKISNKSLYLCNAKSFTHIFSLEPQTNPVKQAEQLVNLPIVQVRELRHRKVTMLF